MKIGIPKEIKIQEARVSVFPGAVAELIKAGHEVYVEEGAGVGAGYPDEQYVAAGARIVTDPAEVYRRATLIVKVKEPQLAELELLRPDHVLFAYLHLAADRKLTEKLLASGCTAIAYETLEVNRQRPLLEPMSEIAGRMSTLMGAYHLAKNKGGRGFLVGGVPGVAPGRVVVLGGGTAGMNAARVAHGIGADVTILEVNIERMRELEVALPGVHCVYSNETNLTSLLPSAELVIASVLVPGARAPKLLTREMLRLMQPGTVLVDIAVDQGGCAETTRATTHDAPTYVEEGVLHYCVANMPGAYSRTATQALNNATQPWIARLAKLGVRGACAEYPELLSGINTIAGALTCEAVADAHDMNFQDPAERLA